MEQVIQIYSNSTKSLRDKILNDKKGLLAKQLKIRKEKGSKGKRPWSEIVSDEGHHGIIKFVRDETTNVLTCRIENSKPGTPYPLIGIFINYLMEKRKAFRINFIIVVPE